MRYNTFNDCQIIFDKIVDKITNTMAFKTFKSPAKVLNKAGYIASDIMKSFGAIHPRINYNKDINIIEGVFRSGIRLILSISFNDDTNSSLIVSMNIQEVF